jgi:hypothetical protein
MQGTATGSGPGGGIFAQRYSATGTKLVTLITVAAGTRTAGGHWNEGGSVAVNNSGRFVVTWTDQVFDANVRRDKFLVSAQVYGAAGQPVGGNVVLGEGWYYQTRGTDIDNAGNVTVAWAAAPNWNGTLPTVEIPAREIRVRRLSADGSLSDQFVVNTTTEELQAEPSVAATGDGFVVSWNGRGAGDDAGVFTQRYTTTAPLPAAGSAAYDAAIVEYLLSLSDDEER